MNTITKFGIKHNKYDLLGFSTASNSDGDFCTDVEFSLDHYNDNVWLVDRREQAEEVIGREGDWFNAHYSNPLNSYDSSELQVVEVTISF